MTFQLLQVFDSNAGELGPALFNKFGLIYLRQLAYGVKERLTEQNIEHVPMVSTNISRLCVVINKSVLFMLVLF